MITGFLKFVFGMIRLVLFLAIFGLIFHTWTIKQGLKLALRWSLGTEVAIESVKMDWKNTGFEVHDIQVGNPRRFPEGMLADIPLAIVSVDLAALSQGVIHLKVVGLNLRKIQVIHSPGRGLNVLELKPLKKQKERARATQTMKEKISTHMPQVVIDELILSMGDITFVEMLGAVEKSRTIHLGIRGAAYYDLRGTGDIAYLIVSLALKRLGYNLLGEPFKQFTAGNNSNDFIGNFLDRLKKSLSE